MTSLAHILLHGAERFRDRLAVADPFESISYGVLAREASQLGRVLRAAKHDPGARSLIVLPNSVYFVRAHFANLLAGLISVPCDASLSADTLRSIAGSCEPACLLTDAATLARLTASGGLPGSIRTVVTFGGRAAGAGDAAELMDEQPADLLDVPRDEHATATIMYTTGTTGCPKGVPLTHANVLAALRSIIEFVGYSQDDREVVVLPLSHSFGLGHLYCNLMSGGAVYTENGLARVGRVLKAVENFGATGFPGTPMGFGMLLDQYGPIFAERARGLRFSVINSAPLPPERTAQLRQLLPRLDVMVYYGLTEASRSTFISLTREGPSYYRSVGRPMKHVAVQIHTADGGVAAVGDTGEVTISGPAVVREYWKNSCDTALVFRDGRLHTGDLGYLDAQGFLWITGRIKDIINVGGYKVNPTDVEKVLTTWPGVRDAGVVGVEGVGGLTGEAVIAALVLAPDCALNEVELQQYCVARLEKFKVPTRFVAVPEVSRTNTGKIRRAELHKLVIAALGAGAAPRF